MRPVQTREEFVPIILSRDVLMSATMNLVPLLKESAFFGRFSLEVRATIEDLLKELQQVVDALHVCAKL